MADRPAGRSARVERRYRPGTLVLETTFHTDDGVVRLTDCMPVRGDALDLVRRVEGVSGRVPMRMHLTVRFDYGSIVPWVRRRPEGAGDGRRARRAAACARRWTCTARTTRPSPSSRCGRASGSRSS